jgi:ABC-type dipeptide/oligopeptide/nickel transport system permease component
VLVNAIFLKDYPVVVGGALIAAVLVTVINLAVDLFYGYLDPRIRVS